MNKSEPSSLADPRGGARDARPPWGSKFFHFHAVFGKNVKNNSNFGSWRPPLGKILDPPLILSIGTGVRYYYKPLSEYFNLVANESIDGSSG